MFRQLCYLSSAANGLSDTSLTDILDTARAANGPAGVSGILAYGDGLFFQVLEGAPEAVEAAYQRIASDGRHRNLRVIQDATVEARDFTGCPMGFRRLDADALRLVAARARAAYVPVSEMVAVLGDPAAAAKTQRLPLAA